MTNLYLKQTPSTPEVHFTPQGHISIEGRYLPEDPLDFYRPLIDWIEQYAGNTIIADIKLEYFNTSTSKVLYDMLAKVIHKKTIKQKEINWHYEEGDDDTLEIGQYFEELLEFPFNFLCYQEVY